MTKTASPLVGYNTNVRHHGKLYHIQTEDSGVNRPHITTHVFADGGRIIASQRTSYAEFVDTEHYPSSVKKLMQEQHKAMFIALRDGVYDNVEAEPTKSVPPESLRPGRREPTVRLPEVDAPLSTHAAAHEPPPPRESPRPRQPTPPPHTSTFPSSRPKPSAGLYQSTIPSRGARGATVPPPRSPSSLPYSEPTYSAKNRSTK